jgi:hypothetical protein
MLEVYLHAGFHKSGTTSVQSSLSDYRSTSVIYPVPLSLGPGHCYLASRCVNIKDKDFEPKLLVKLAEHYDRIVPRRNVAKLVLSSECFGTGDNFKSFQILANRFPTKLLLTRRVAWEAIPSRQQENIKWGSASPYLSEQAEHEALADPQFNLNSIRRILASAPFTQKFVITTSSDKPSFIFSSFNEILGTKLKVRVGNQSLPTSLIRSIQNLNKHNSFSSVKERIDAGARFVAGRNLDSDLPGTAEQLKRWMSIEDDIQAALNAWRDSSDLKLLHFSA